MEETKSGELKRRAGQPSGAIVPAKKVRDDLALVSNARKEITVSSGPPRTSSLEAPTMLLSGHNAEIFSLCFHPGGEIIASAGFDRRIFLWNVYGEAENYAILPGSKGAILDMCFDTEGDSIFTASSDKAVVIWDVDTGSRTRRFRGHTGIANCVSVTKRGVNMVCSGSDDCTIKYWDPRKKTPIASLDCGYQVLAVGFNDTGDQIISGGIDNDLKVWDLRKRGVIYKMRGHSDSVTGLSLSPNGNYMLSNSMDNSLRVWDIRPFSTAESRCTKIFQGHQHNFEKNLLRCSWSREGARVAAGSGDRFVYIWDFETSKITYKLPGHSGSVNDVVFHPIEPIIASASSDQQIYLGEIEEAAGSIHY